MKFDIKKVKIMVMVPRDYLEKVRMEVFKGGAGVIGNYTHCSTSFSGVGTFRPNKDAQPFLGVKEKLEYAYEEKLEFVCDIALVRLVLKAIRDVHPYEEPGIDIIPLLDELDFEHEKS